MRIRGIALAVAVLAGAATGATAQSGRAYWMQAKTPHFIVYSKDKEENVRALATDLERFDSVIRKFHSASDDAEDRSNPVTVYVAGSVERVQELCGRCSNVYGFYSPRVSGAVAFTPRTAYTESKFDLDARTVLFHEYGHHFLLGNYLAAYPPWFSEGYAEFVSTVAFKPDRVLVGTPALHRAYGLILGEKLPAKLLFDPAAIKRLTGAQTEQIYGRGWLLTHYVMFNKERRAQFGEYLRLLNNGTPSVAAGEKAFGSLAQLDRDLDKYLTAKTMSTAIIKLDTLPQPQVTLRPLSAGEAAMIDLRMNSTRGVDGKTAPPLFKKAQPIAARYPDDPVVQGWFAEMALDAGEIEAAGAAADRAIAADPKSTQGLLYKGFALLAAAQKAKAPPPAWAAARQFIVRANKLDPNAAAPLDAYYDSFGREGRTPTASAIAGLYRAQELVPQDPGLRFEAVTQSVEDGDIARARRLLAPLAYSPHGSGESAAAALLAALEKANDKASAQAAIKAAFQKSQKDGKD
jgi:tetratricopeptide (TPR) repeat protein